MAVEEMGGGIDKEDGEGKPEIGGGSTALGDGRGGRGGGISSVSRRKRGMGDLGVDGDEEGGGLPNAAILIIGVGREGGVAASVGLGGVAASFEPTLVKPELTLESCDSCCVAMEGGGTAVASSCTGARIGGEGRSGFCSTGGGGSTAGSMGNMVVGIEEETSSFGVVKAGTGTTVDAVGVAGSLESGE